MMINFNINREDFIDQKKLGVVRIENQIEDIHINHMEILINYFKQEYSWDKMFKLEDVFNRLKEGHTFLFYFQTNLRWAMFGLINLIMKSHFCITCMLLTGSKDQN